MQVVGRDGAQQRAARQALGPKVPKLAHMPHNEAPGRAMHVAPPRAIKAPHPLDVLAVPHAQQVRQNRQIHQAMERGLRGSGIVGSVAHGVSAGLGIPQLEDAARNLVHGHDPRLTKQQYQRDVPVGAAIDRGVLKSLIPQSLVDIAHGRRPTASHAGQDALFFLPWSRAGRAVGEGALAAHAAEDSERAVEAARAAKESYQSGKGIGGGLASAAKKQLPAERALARSASRNELHAALDDAHEPQIANALKSHYDKTIKAAARNTGQSVDEVAGRLLHVRSHLAPHELPDDLKGLYQHAAPLEHQELPALKVKGLSKKVERLIQKGAPYRDWYARGAHVLMDAADRLGVSHKQMAAVTAVMSQGANPTFNLKRAVEAIQEFKATGKIDPGRYLGGQAEKTEHILGNPDTFNWSGLKTNSYFGNFMHHMDPAEFTRMFGNERHVTVDRHMAAMFYGKQNVTPKQYENVKRMMTEAADQLGWHPSEVQAAAWVPWKAAGLQQTEAVKALSKEMEARGEIPDHLIAPKGISEKERVKIGKQRAAFVREAWDAGDRPLAHVPKPVENYMPSAGDAYERGQAKYRGTLYQEAEPHTLEHDTFNPRVAQVTSEANPDPKLWPRLRAAYDKLSPEDQIAYSRAMDQAQNGVFEHALGLDHLGNREGLGIWRGAGSHGNASHLLIGPGEITPEVRQDMEALTAAQGMAKHQNSVSWGRPVPPAAGEFRGIHWTPPEGVNPIEASSALDKIAGDGNVGFIHAPDGGFYVINFSGEQGADFALRRLGGEQTDIGWQGGYTIDHRIKGEDDWAPSYKDAIDKLPQAKRSALELAMTKVRGQVEQIDAHYLGGHIAKIVDADEARKMAAAGTHVFHGTGGLTAEQIMAERTLRTGDSHPEAAWTTQDPATAEFYTGPFSHSGNIVAIPRDKIPMGEGDATHPLNHYGSPDDILFQHGDSQLAHMGLDELHARADHLNAKYDGLVNDLAAGEGKPYKVDTAMRNLSARKLARKGLPNPTAKQELRDIAESKLTKYMDAHPEDPRVQQLHAEHAESNAIRQEIYRRNDTLFQSDKLNRVLAAIHKFGHTEPYDKDMGKSWYDIGANPQAVGTDKLMRDIARGIGHLTGQDRKDAEDILHELGQKGGGEIKGAFEPVAAHGAIIHLTQHADVTTFPHEFAHFIRRYGLSPEHEAALAEWAGAKDGVWNRAAEEKFARGWEKMIRQGEAPNNQVSEFQKLSPLFKEVYPDTGKLATVPPHIAQVYKQIMGHRDGPQALYWLLHNRLAAHSLAAEARQGAPRTPEEAHEHVLQMSKLAEEEGHGRALPKVTSHDEGDITPETGGAEGALVRKGLVGVGKERNEQEAERAVERSRRAGAVRNAAEGGNGLERHIAAKTELEGKLPAGSFKGFEEAEPHLEPLLNHIYEHPNLRPYEKVSAADALLDGVNGKVPTKSDQKLLERAFGKQKGSLSQQLKDGTFGEKIANVLNVPRALMASGDLSAPFRQGLVVLASHPKMFFEGFPSMLKVAKSEATFQDGMKALHEMPSYPLAEKSGLSITEIGDEIGGREEQFASNMAEHLHELPVVKSTPGVKQVAKGASSVVRGSDRAYVLFLNQTRMRLFDLLSHQAAEEGYHLNDKLSGDIAKFVNSATGRGDLGALSDHAATLNTMFFSPRLLKSRLDFLNPHYYMTMEPFARKQALRAAIRLAGTMSTVLMFAKAAGATVVDDPRNADFGKIRIGNTRLDIAGGFTQPMRLVAQLASGQIVSSQTGQLENLSGTGFGRSRLDVTSQFLENKFAPVPSVITDLLRGSQFGGQPITAQSELVQHMTPLLWQDIAQIYHSTGPAGAVGYGLPDVFGVGVQNYGAPGPKTKQNLSKLDKSSVLAGLGNPPAQVQADVKWKSLLDAATYTGQTEMQKATAAAKLYDQRYGTHISTTTIHQIQTQGQAEKLYTELRSRLFPSLEKWQSAVNRSLTAKKDQQPVPQQPVQKQSAPAPTAPRAVVTDAQDAAYHVPIHDTASPEPPQGQQASPNALTAAAEQISSELASGTYNPSSIAKTLMSSMASQPLTNTMVNPATGEHIKFSIPKYAGPLGKAARGAVALAEAYLGTPYVWGGESPKGFDCSGLAQYVYAKLGISIPRTSEEQYASGSSVPKSRLKPGDLVFFAGSDGTMQSPGHVGIYIGHGKFIEAPHTGANVRISNLAGYPGYVGARRYSKAKARRKAA